MALYLQNRAYSRFCYKPYRSQGIRRAESPATRLR